MSFSGLASPTQHDLNGTEVVLSQGKTKPEIISEQLVNFFNPVSKCHCDHCGIIFNFPHCEWICNAEFIMVQLPSLVYIKEVVLCVDSTLRWYSGGGGMIF